MNKLIFQFFSKLISDFSTESLVIQLFSLVIIGI